ncbi:MAG: protein phosphatase 2C domain-containing protein [Thermodesulfobacteriota bacterium]|nr:protein phosphatase 2C domain-containing protein [Thermodesulfobacteriota bacterium]
MRVDFISLTDIGLKKKTNEDRVCAKQINEETWLFAIADGLGGQPGGAVAADAAMAVMENFQPQSGNLEQQVTDLLLKANEEIIKEGEVQPNFCCMGSTADVVLLREYKVYWAHIGDSRVYHLRKNQLKQVTSDQNLAGELFEEGQISEEERDVHPGLGFLTQSLGEDDIEPDSGSFSLTSGDIFMLCSDGLHDLISRKTIEYVLRGNLDLEIMIEVLKREALAAGGDDNIGLVLARIG